MGAKGCALDNAVCEAYHRRRLHSTLGYLSPEHYENRTSSIISSASE